MIRLLSFQYWYIILVPTTPEPECWADEDCQTNLACIDENCQNPCRVNNLCTGEQKCVVKDTHPTRTAECVCPEGMVFSDQGYCQIGKWTNIHYFIS